MSGGLQKDKFNIVIEHGVDGYPEKSWYGTEGRALSAEGHNVVIPQFPTLLPAEGIARSTSPEIPEKLRSYQYQTLAEWNAVTAEVTKKWASKSQIDVGHSLGGLQVLRDAEQHGASGNPLHAVFAIAPVGGDLPQYPKLQPGLKTFYDGINWKNVRKGAKTIIVFASDNDPVIPFVQSWDVAQKAKADLFVIVPNGGHLNADSGFDAQKGLPFLLPFLHAVMKHGTKGIRPEGQVKSGEPYIYRL